MKHKIFLFIRKRYKAEFNRCYYLEDVRSWLNECKPFINIDDKIIININNIDEIKPIKKSKICKFIKKLKLHIQLYFYNLKERLQNAIH
jgi:hypothetical protein